MSGHAHHPAPQPPAAGVLAVLDAPAVRARAAELVRRYPVPSAALLPLLWLAQERVGWIPLEAARWAARLAGVSPARAWGVATFYTMYRQAPAGRYLLQVCHNISCNITGAEAVLAHARASLGVEEGGTTTDGLFTLLRAECLGACGNGPVVLVNDDFATDVVDGRLAMPPGVALTPERLDRVIAWCRAAAAAAPRDAAGGEPAGFLGHPGAAGAQAAPQAPDYAPPPPVLGLKAALAEGKAVLSFKAAPEAELLHVERRLEGDDWQPLASVKAKEAKGQFVDAALPAGRGAEYRVACELKDGRRAAPRGVSLPGGGS